MANKYKVTPISAETLAAIKRKSAFSLPDRPSERGMKPEEIKKTLYGPITDNENSAIAELSRVIGELNKVLAQIEDADNKYNISVQKIEGGHRLTITDENGDKSYDIMDGSDGKDGADGLDGKDGADGTGLPAITEADEGKIVMVTEGAYVLGSADAVVEAAVTEALNTEV